MGFFGAVADSIESDAAERLRRESQWRSPLDMAQDLDRRVRRTPALDLLDRELSAAAMTPDTRLLVSFAPQEGKSQLVSRRFPTWLLARRPDTRIAIASYEATIARRWGRAVRDDVSLFHTRLGINIRGDVSAQSEWQLEKYDGGVITVGTGGALTGRPVDCLIVDDPVKGSKQVSSELFRSTMWDWWTDTALTRLSPGAVVIVVMTRWHQDDLAGRIMAAPDAHRWRVITVPALADHRPERGERDVLGREPGQWMRSARGRTDLDWQAIRVQVGERTFNALYQGRPSAAEGTIWRRSWWRSTPTRLWTIQADGSYRVRDPGARLIMSWDMAFKGTADSDYVVGQVWAKIGPDIHLLEQVRRQATFTETLTMVKGMARRWPQARPILVEDKANGTAVLSSLRRRIPGFVAENPTDSKIGRATAVAPMIEAGNVFLPTADTSVGEWDLESFLAETSDFPNSTHDDQVDATSQALRRAYLPEGAGSSWLEYIKKQLAERQEAVDGSQ